jgi:hypothetical protein
MDTEEWCSIDWTMRKRMVVAVPGQPIEQCASTGTANRVRTLHLRLALVLHLPPEVRENAGGDTAHPGYRLLGHVEQLVAADEPTVATDQAGRTAGVGAGSRSPATYAATPRRRG